jgi:hypothetical protein
MNDIIGLIMEAFKKEYGEDTKIDEDDLVVGIFNDGVVIVTFEETENGKHKLKVNANLTDSVFKFDSDIL